MKRRKHTEAPCSEQHTPCPTLYLQWHAWAARMSKTHRQQRCTFCGLWAVWVERTKRAQVFVMSAPKSALGSGGA